MDFLNKYFAQIRELFEGMTPGARITSALLLAVTVASLGYLFTSGFNTGGDVYLLDNYRFNSDQMSAVLGAFATEGLASPEVVGGQIRVARGKEMAYVAAMAKANVLPHDISWIDENALKESGTFEDKTKFQARLRNAKQRKIGEILRAVPNYEQATVIISDDIKPGLYHERVVRAAVSVKAIGSRPLTDEQVQSIRQTVKAVDAGLKLEDITVTDLNTGRAYTVLPGDLSGGQGSPMAQEQRRLEEYWRVKIMSHLGLIPGVIVTPTVELSPLKEYRTHSTEYNKDKSISVNMSEQKTSRESIGEAHGGRPGYPSQASNASRSITTTEAKGAEEKEKSSELVESKLPAGEETEKEYAAHTPERVSVAIAVPTSWFTQIWQRQNPAPEGEEPPAPTATDIDKIRVTELDRIKTAVAGVLPQAAGITDLTELVTVTDMVDIAPAPIPEPTLTENATSWFARNWSTVGLILLGLFSLLMLRSMIRSTPPGSAGDMAAYEPAVGEGGEGEDAEESGEPQKMAFAGSGTSLRDELTELVATDPETAANILKNWIGAATK